MSIVSSNNSSENNLTPDELLNTQRKLSCCSTNHNILYPLYENRSSLTNFPSNNNYSTTTNDKNLMRNNFTTILEVPRSQSISTCNNQIINNNNVNNQLITSTSNNVITSHVTNGNNSNNNSLQRFTINKIGQCDLENIYSTCNKNNLIKLNNSNSLNDHYANLPQQQFNNQQINYNSQINRAFNNNIYSIKQQNQQLPRSNSSNDNNICILECQSSNESRSCLTTPESKSNEHISVISKSQPDLSNLENEMNCINIKTDLALESTNRTNLINTDNNTNEFDNNTEIDLLRIENAYLKEKLDTYAKKISKLQKFEMEMQKVNKIEQMYNELMLSAEKKEKLERAARYKLEIEVKRLHQQNKANLIKIDQLTTALTNISKEEKEFKKEDAQKTDLLFSQLLNQNKELINTKERQEIELQAQRLTLEEQRNHIQILDQALLNTQNNVIALENKLRKKMIYEEQANNLQKAFNNLQLTKYRLEKEVELLKNNQKQNNILNNSNVSSSINSNDNELEKSRKLLKEYENKLINLESVDNKWEQKYLEDNTIRQIESNSNTVSKDTKNKISSLETEKLILEARNERLRYMDELDLHEASKKTTENTIKDLENKLAEKDAMIKVLHSLDRDNNHVTAQFDPKILAQRSSLNKHTRSVSSIGLVNNSTGTQNNLIARNLKNLSISGCSTVTSPINRYPDSASSRTSGYSSTSNNSSTGSCTEQQQQNNSLKSPTNSIIDEKSLKEFDKRLTNKTSIIRALRNERERYY